MAMITETCVLQYDVLSGRKSPAFQRKMAQQSPPKQSQWHHPSIPALPLICSSNKCMNHRLETHAAILMAQRLQE
jgi:hypothetical protein